MSMLSDKSILTADMAWRLYQRGLSVPPGAMYTTKELEFVVKRIDELRFELGHCYQRVKLLAEAEKVPGAVAIDLATSESHWTDKPDHKHSEFGE